MNKGGKKNKIKERQDEKNYVILENWSTSYPYERGITDLRFVFVDQSNVWRLGEKILQPKLPLYLFFTEYYYGFHSN